VSLSKAGLILTNPRLRDNYLAIDSSVRSDGYSTTFMFSPEFHLLNSDGIVLVDKIQHPIEFMIKFDATPHQINHYLSTGNIALIIDGYYILWKPNAGFVSCCVP
jgi:hypothetical protein